MIDYIKKWFKRNVLHDPKYEYLHNSKDDPIDSLSTIDLVSANKLGIKTLYYLNEITEDAKEMSDYLGIETIKINDRSRR